MSGTAYTATAGPSFKEIAEKLHRQNQHDIAWIDSEIARLQRQRAKLVERVERHTRHTPPATQYSGG